MNICISILIISLSIYITVIAVERVLNIINNLFPSLGSMDEQSESGEEYDEGVLFKPRYDLEAFRKRMEALKDEDGLYDVIEFKKPDDFTGTEIVDESKNWQYKV